ncbi:MAG: hypothetical protein ACSLEZ_10345 [Thiobacillus sp.]
MTTQDTEIKTAQETRIPESGGRRRFLGTSSAAAPFILTMVSQPALGVTCFSPSRALSQNTSISQLGKDGECLNAESAGNYKAQQVPPTTATRTRSARSGGAYHWPASVKPTDPFHPIFKEGYTPGVTKFTKPGGVSMTFGEALNEQAPGQVHFHLIGAYLNKKGGNGAVIPDSAITETGILTMWDEYATRGYYEPVAGVKWYGQEIVDYLKSNGIVG